MKENKIKKSSILLIIFMMVLVIIVGTYAWFTYRSNKTAMVLTIGELNNVQVTLSPYQIMANISSQTTYTSNNYTSVTAVNNSNSSRNIRLYYKIDSISNELISSNFKYTIERSTNGTTYSQYKTGNFSTASNGGELTILEESIPSSTTYNYKVYIWLDGTTSGQNNIIGKTFNGELRAAIAENQYQVTFDAAGGNVSMFSKVVTLGENYGVLPTPTRSGYTFLGWHGVNLLENTDTLSGYTYPASTLDIENTFDGSYSVKTNRAWLGMYINLKELYTQNKIKLGDQLTYSVYAKTNFNFTKNTTFSLYRAYNTSSTPRISISPSNMPTNEWKRFSFTFNIDESSIESTTARIEADYYDTDDPYYFGNNRENYIWFAAPQLEFGNESTSYELFYITEDSIVTQNKNHTLTAMWQKNS